jgi:hypothetical protein
MAAHNGIIFLKNPHVLSALSEIVIKRKVVNWNLWNAIDKVKRKCTEKYACNETNLMHYLSSVYSVTIPLHVSGLLVAHHQEATICIFESWDMLYVLVDCQPTWCEWNTLLPPDDGQLASPKHVDV